jgi:hypothetical protein
MSMMSRVSGSTRLRRASARQRTVVAEPKDAEFYIEPFDRVNQRLLSPIWVMLKRLTFEDLLRSDLRPARTAICRLPARHGLR